MMEEDGDDFGPLYSDVLKPCPLVKGPCFLNDEKPSIFHARSDLSGNVAKDLKDYDGFLLSECGVDEGVLLPECGLTGDFDDVIFDVEMEQNEINEYNEVNVLWDMMEDGDLERENSRASTDEDICVNLEDSESDETLDIMIEDGDLNDDDVGSSEKAAVKPELGLMIKIDDPYDLDEIEPGEIVGMKQELGIDVEARVGHSYQPFHTVSKGVRSECTPRTVDTDFKAEKYQVNPVHHANYNFGGTRLRYLPTNIKKAFNIEDDYSGYKPWKRPGVKLSDYFNFDLDEEKWQNYCKQMKELLQTSPPRIAAAGYRSKQLKSRRTLGKRIGQAIQVHTSPRERVVCLQNHYQREYDSDAIIEIVSVDSPDDTVSFTKDLKHCALRDYEKRPTKIHKVINGDMILPFPFDGCFHQVSHEESWTSYGVEINYAQEARQWTYFNSMVSKEKDHISYQDQSMHIYHAKEGSEAEQGLRGELMKSDKVLPLYSSKEVRKNNEGQTTFRDGLEDDYLNSSGEKRLRQGDGKYKKSLKQPDEPKPTANMCAYQEISGNRFNNCRMRMEETLYQTDHQERNNDNKLNKGKSADEDNCGIRIQETLSQTDHLERENDNMLIKGSAVDVDFTGEQGREPTDHPENEFPINCNVANEVEKDEIFEDQKDEASRQDSENMQGSPRATESYDDVMTELMSNIKGFMDEVDELVGGQKYDHDICCLRLTE